MRSKQFFIIDDLHMTVIPDLIEGRFSLIFRDSGNPHDGSETVQIHLVISMDHLKKIQGYANMMEKNEVF